MERHQLAADARAELASVVTDLVTRFGMPKKEIAAAIGTDPSRLSWMLSPSPPRLTTTPPEGWRQRLAEHLASKGGEMAAHSATLLTPRHTK